MNLRNRYTRKHGWAIQESNWNDQDQIHTFTLRMPRKIVRQIAEQNKAQPIPVSMNQWIRTAINERLESDQY